MILQLNRLNHHRHMSEPSLALLHAFRSQLIGNLSESLKLGSDNFLSLKSIHHCFQTLPILNNAFAKLMGEIDYPVSNWEAGSIEEFLDYTINLLELLNAINSSLSKLNQARVSLSHALSLMESSPAMAVERMREITLHDSIGGFKVSGGGEERNRNWNGKEWIFHEAMKVMESIGFWVCGVVLMGLKGDCSFMPLDSIFSNMISEEWGLVKEVEGVNESVRLILTKRNGDSDDGMELKRRLEVVGDGLKGLKEEEEGVFAMVMAARNEVLETLRRKNK